ncbi:hypothetical protein RKE29_06705 [Streptomyces sp. B1866]|uniref:hypothetical protein n=1 Tax=Streptomyces sp. B1866 TaxID=3075431 RepID=UPI00288D13C0|nr:hypothetical protein [Streptomyces sp. B1866]MDT3396332.1 hypothetical protein [Streptomyces sp. B1866]
MAARLRAAVHLTHPDTREPLILQPGDTPEPALTALITNPAAWDNGEQPPDEPDAPRPDGQDPPSEPPGQPAAGRSRKTTGTPAT